MPEKVWRYISFSRLVWLLQKKQLWLSRADLLGDPWEISLAGKQLARVISRHPIVPVTERLSGKRAESAMERSERIIKSWRRQTFINCWTASNHESHALWRIYCPSVEGVAIQTTFARLQGSLGGLPLYRVTYEIPGSNARTPTISDLASKKRPMFSYEQEVRVILATSPDQEADTGQGVRGHCIQWDPEKHVETVRVHPEADCSFMETVVAIIEHYAPALRDVVKWSAMSDNPPFQLTLMSI